MANELLEAALAYAARGWPTFPLLAKGKRPLTLHGFKDATTDEATIRAWWRKWPRANLGIPTGTQTFDVLDVDVARDGEASLAALEAKHGDLPFGIRAHTGGGGRHLLFRGGSLPVVGADRLARGLDIKSIGGYVVVEPSVHPSGAIYRWEDYDEGGIPDPPSWLVEELQAVVSVRRDLDPLSLQAVLEGERHGVILSMACSLRAYSFDGDALLQAVRHGNRHRCQPPLPEEEVAAIVQHALTLPLGPSLERVRAAERAAGEEGVKLAVRAARVEEKEQAAREIATARGAIETSNLDGCREIVAKALGIRVVKLIQAGRDHAEYSILLEGYPEAIHLGEKVSREWLGELLFRHGAGQGLIGLQAKQWPLVRGALLQLVEVHEEAEMERKTETLGWIEGYLWRHNLTAAARNYESVSSRSPLREGDMVGVNIPHFLNDLGRQAGGARSQGQLVARLRELGWEKQKVSVWSDGRQFQASTSYWFGRFTPCIETKKETEEGEEEKRTPVQHVQHVQHVTK